MPPLPPVLITAGLVGSRAVSQENDKKGKEKAQDDGSVWADEMGAGFREREEGS
jgi:hypothetical protein